MVKVRKMVITFDSVDEILRCVHTIKLKNLFGGNSHGTIYLLMQFYFLSLWMKSFGVTIQMKPLISAVLSHCTTVFNVVLTFESVDKILLCDYSNETS